jgi:endonuclease/exonuclease/phosphatase (EEP) superfamily protein YafD
MTSWPRILGASVAIGLSGCLAVPVTHQAMQVDSPDARPMESPFCDAAREPTRLESNGEAGLDPGQFRVLTWNVHKGDAVGWLTDLAWFGGDHDLMLMQEARLSESLRRVLRERDLHWTLGGAFRFRGLDTGVLTAARARADLACMLRAMEPLTRVPKAVVVTRHPFAGSSTSLLVANVHAVNFTLGTSELSAQLEAVATILARHRGPVILAGDFNTWSAARRGVVDALVLRLGLEAVSVAPDERSRFLGRPVDQIYFRGLVASSAMAIRVRSSDHNPVSAVFRLADRERASSPW